jgi:uncharacterized protein
MPPVVASMLWRRLDLPGHDACGLARDGAGWSLRGTAAFLHPAGPASIAYAVRCDSRWQTVSAEIKGLLGGRRVGYSVAHRGRRWSLNGQSIAGLEHLVDLDLGFTPATNLQQIRRVPMPEGVAVALPVAWLDLDAGTLTQLPQIYERRSDTLLRYEAPSVGYQDLLELAPSGFIRKYPGLWEAEEAPPA